MLIELLAVSCKPESYCLSAYSLLLIDYLLIAAAKSRSLKAD